MDVLGIDPNIEGLLFGKRKRTKYTKRRKTKPKTSKKITPSHTKKFHSKKSSIDNIILQSLDDGEIIYGEQALKARFPKYLERPTQDYDILTDHPRREAKDAERMLDKHFGGDFFYVEEAQHPGTWKVKAYANDSGYADFSKKPKKKIPHDKIKKRNYVKLSYEKANRRKSLRDPESAWRHGKDRDALNRIKVYEASKKRKKRRK